jgi:hypothetical protein
MFVFGGFMPIGCRLLPRLALLALSIGFAFPAAAQVPVATGRNIAMVDSHWKLFIPDGYVQSASVDLIVNFHGDDATFRNNVKWANLNVVEVTVNYSGLSSAYQTPFSDPALFQSLLDDALAKVRGQPDFPDAINYRKVAVSSFSAGYGAVREILKQPGYFNRIDALLAADSLYASFTSSSDHTPLDSQMTNYRQYATAAANGTKTFIFSHSQVPTFTYCETRECADDLMAWVGTSPVADNSQGLGELDFYRYAKKGNFVVHGALGTDGDSHLEHLRYMGQFLQELPLAVVPEPTMGLLPASIFLLALRRPNVAR